MFVIAWEMTWNDDAALGGLLVCLAGMAISGLLSLFGQEERGLHVSQDESLEPSFITRPRAVFVAVWLSVVGAGSWARSASLGLSDLADRSELSLTCSFGADLLTVAWGAWLGHRQAWRWIVPSAVAAAGVSAVASAMGYESSGIVGDGPYVGLAFVVDLVVLGLALLVGASCAALVRSGVAGTRR